MTRPAPTSTQDLPHPIVARMWNRMSTSGADRGMADHRREVLAGLAGRVIELGAGNGINFAYYPPEVTQVVAVEPEPFLRQQAATAARHAPVPVEVRPGVAGHLDMLGASFDGGVASLVLCSVPDVERTLAELFRIIRPGGVLHFYEHVRSDRPVFARCQQVFDVAWVRVNGWGCHAGRDTPGAIERAGFIIETMRRFTFRLNVLEHLLSPHVIGVARRP